MADGQTTPVGQVTKLPHLDSQSSVSLTTQVLPTSARTSTSRKTTCGGQHSSAPTSRSAISATTTTLVTTASASAVDGVVARVANLNIKQRSSKQRGKAHHGGKSSSKSGRGGGKDRSNASHNSSTSATASAAAASSSISTSAKTLLSSSQACGVAGAVNESLRWELVLEDVDKERERIALYKMNRRKRYLAAAQAKGLRWAMNYNSSQTAVSPFSEDSGVEMACGASPKAAYVDFGTMQSLRPIPARRGLQEAFVEC